LDIWFQLDHTHWKEKKLPHRRTLDQFIPDRPVFLFNEECHGAWVNSKALELMGIDHTTPNLPFGEIVRDDIGDVTGFLYETAMGFASIAFTSMPKAMQVQLFENFLQLAAKYGVTSVSDMLPLPGLELGNLELYREYEKKKKLTTRIHFLAALDGNLDRPRKLRELYQSSTLQFSGLKQFLDGVPTTYTAYMLEPYSDRPNTRGNTLIPIEKVKQWTVEADREYFRIRFHACGDGAVRLGLDLFERARKENGTRDSRHTIEHIEVIDPADIPRFKELGVIASMQPHHMAVGPSFSDNVYLKRLGQREKYTWPIRSLQESGAVVAFGTDFPVVTINPFMEIYRAITRTNDSGEPLGGWNPSEKISLSEALKHYTIDAAYGIFREHELGTLGPGKLADIIVLDRDLFHVSAEEIKNTNVLLTMMDGNIVYQFEDSTVESQK
jgi:predicted amidohydrolase YtcJ